jgi:hypothetical protein
VDVFSWVITALVLWCPLGVIRLRSARDAFTTLGQRAGTYIGVAVVLVTLIVVGFRNVVSR